MSHSFIGKFRGLLKWSSKKPEDTWEFHTVVTIGSSFFHPEWTRNRVCVVVHVQVLGVVLHVSVVPADPVADHDGDVRAGQGHEESCLQHISGFCCGLSSASNIKWAEM